MEEKKTFEQKIKELEKTVSELENGNVDLDSAIKKYSSAMMLAKECSDELKNAEEQVNKILKENGHLENFSIDE